MGLFALGWKYGQRLRIEREGDGFSTIRQIGVGRHIEGQLDSDVSSPQSFSIPVTVGDGGGGWKLLDNILYVIGGIAGLVIISFIVAFAYFRRS